MGSFLSSRVRFEKMHAQKRVELKWMFLLTPGSCNCLTSTEHQQLLPSLAGQTAYHTTLSDSSPLRKRRRQGSMELGQGVVCFYICSFFFFFFTAAICDFAPSPLSYVWKPQRNSACTGPSAACLDHELEKTEHLPGCFRTCRQVQLDIGYRAGSGEACHGAAGTDAGRGLWAGVYGHREADLVFPETKQTLSSLLCPK